MLIVIRVLALGGEFLGRPPLQDHGKTIEMLIVIWVLGLGGNSWGRSPLQNHDLQRCFDLHTLQTAMQR